MDAWSIGRKCGVIGQLVWLSMCERGRCICSDIRQMVHALDRHTTMLCPHNHAVSATESLADGPQLCHA
eukprot:4097134-Pleurochrysis_carterae.AAC.1